jgi:hypothetical protein
MTPCRDCTTTQPRDATHRLRYDWKRHAWSILRVTQPNHTRLYCKWHAIVRATQLNAAIRRPRDAAAKGA